MPETTEVERRLEQLWKAEEVAARFRVGRSKVYELIRTGELRSLRIGGSRRVPESAIAEYLEHLA